MLLMDQYYLQCSKWIFRIINNLMKRYILTLVTRSVTGECCGIDCHSNFIQIGFINSMTAYIIYTLKICAIIINPAIRSSVL